MWWSVHQPQWGSPELRHSPQVVYCSQDSTGTRDTCQGSTHRGSALLAAGKRNKSSSASCSAGSVRVTQQRFANEFVSTSTQKSVRRRKYWGLSREAPPSLGAATPGITGAAEPQPEPGRPPGTSSPGASRPPCPEPLPGRRLCPLLPDLQLAISHLPWGSCCRRKNGRE